VGKNSPHLSLEKRETRLSLNLFLGWRGAAGGEVEEKLKLHF
jgi:hypothetical protein